MTALRLIAATALALAAAERADRSEALARAAARAARRAEAANGTATEVAQAGTGEFPYNAVTDFLGDDSKGLVKEGVDLAAHLSGELNTHAGQAVGKADEYSDLLRQLHAGNDLVVATVHDFKTAVGEHAKGKLQESVSEVNSAAEGGGASVGVKEVKSEDIMPSTKMTSEGVEEFVAAQFGLQSITFKEGTGELSDESQARVTEEFAKPLERAKGKAGPGAKFLFCIFYSTTAGADNVKEGLMAERGGNLEKIIKKHADEILGGDSYKVGGKFEGYESDRLGAIVYKVAKGGQEAPACSPKDAEIAESGKSA
mmetsp:Transcript_110516/g.299860  ORF Transcript_110516/g.299860 Transcript_110516/m.299860 type:complete len:313 (+) Transcript_110516:70-1008(+)